jgi:hypothetical protein
MVYLCPTWKKQGKDPAVIAGARTTLHNIDHNGLKNDL